MQEIVVIGIAVIVVMHAGVRIDIAVIAVTHDSIGIDTDGMAAMLESATIHGRRMERL